MVEVGGVLYNETKCKELEKVWNSVSAIDELRGKSIVIVGATGTIGAYLVEFLCYANENKDVDINVFAVSRKRETLRNLFGEESERLHFVEQDINQPFSIDEEVDYIVHAAGNAHPASFCADPVGTILNSVNGTRNLLELARCKSAKLLYLSSGEVYGGGVQPELGWTEEDKLEFNTTMWRSCYPIGKSAAENLCACYGEQYGTSYVIARLCHTFGANITASDNRACAQFVTRASKGEDIHLLSEGLNIRSYLYVGDAVSAIFTLLIRGERGQIYNIAGDETVSIRQFAELCAECGKVRVSFQTATEIEKKAQTYINHQILNNEKIKTLDWKNVFSIKEGIDIVIQRLRTQ